ncbi:uncharacterized protein LOC110097432 [Dendrobium catenatum]|uniref:uncharacterized protein LOC110097432 n=1 Tax=Dendrobium catenatum TaxID=906689 RepID=UPI0010A05F51|nr:uncharacterized protein LOC110097432 [Dendrobium catenatum]
MSLPNIASWNVRGFNNPDKVRFCKSLIQSQNLKFLCVLEAKISLSSVEDPWFLHSHSLFDSEGSYNNFKESTPGRIWLKWDSSVFNFHPILTTSQLIHGVLSAGSFPPIFLSVVYACNSVAERRSLWTNLENSIPPPNQPWVILGDFNCCRFETEKAGGSLLTDSRLGELNNMVFKCGVQDLSSTELFYTWYNQRVDSPIHIKLDRILVNSALLDYLPLAYYRVVPPTGSDHSPIIFIASHDKPIAARFKFKNYWTNMEGFWDDVFSAFSANSSRSPLAAFSHSLQCLKRSLKKRNWASSNFLSCSIMDLKAKQHSCLIELQNQPLDINLNSNLKSINDDLAALQTHWSSWITQRAKASWLLHGEDDLGFLFAKIRQRCNKNCIKEITTDEGHLTSHSEENTRPKRGCRGVVSAISTAPNWGFSLSAHGKRVVHVHLLLSPIDFFPIFLAVSFLLSSSPYQTRLLNQNQLISLHKKSQTNNNT